MKTKFLIPLMAGLALLCACKGNGGNGSNADSTAVINNTVKNETAKQDTILNGVKLVKTANMSFKVKNVLQTGGQIASLTASLNGTVIHHTIGSTSQREQDIRISKDSIMHVNLINTTAEMTVKIPPAKMEDFIKQVSSMGIYIDSLKMNVNDKSIEHLSAQLKIKNKAEQISQVKHEKSPEELLAMKNNIVDQQMANRATDDSVKNSIITLRFYESNIVNREVIANDDLSNYNPSFSKRLGLSVENGLEVFEDIIIWLANIWILIPLSLGAWITYRYYKNKKAIIITKAD